jgi:general secretion pathway protein G
MKKRYAMTLLEVMIVIFIIGIIGSVVGYNMRGSLDNGRAFKTKEGMRKLYEIVQLESNDLVDDGHLDIKIKQLLKNSNFVRKVDDLMKDGWGEEYRIELEKGDIRVFSEKYEAYCQKKGTTPEYPWR